jgi:hypothetical protein
VTQDGASGCVCASLSLVGQPTVYIYARPELSGVRHNLDQNYQLSFSRNLTSAFVSLALRATVSLTASGDIHEHWPRLRLSS